MELLQFVVKIITSFFLATLLTMVLLAQAPINTLKEIPSQLWAKAVESPKHVAYVFEVIGSVKTFHEKDVCLFFLFS